MSPAATPHSMMFQQPTGAVPWMFQQVAPVATPTTTPMPTTTPTPTTTPIPALMTETGGPRSRRSVSFSMPEATGGLWVGNDTSDGDADDFDDFDDLDELDRSLERKIYFYLLKPSFCMVFCLFFYTELLNSNLSRRLYYFSIIPYVLTGIFGIFSESWLGSSCFKFLFHYFNRFYRIFCRTCQHLSRSSR